MELKVGMKAPDFTLPDSQGKEIALSNLKGKKVVLYFYPKDNTSGCTAEAVSFKENYNKLKKANAEVIGISKDSMASHLNFIQKYDLPFILLSDNEGKVCSLYGVWKEKKMYGRNYMGIERTTFLIDEQGYIQKIFPKVKVKGHIEEIMKFL